MVEVSFLSVVNVSHFPKVEVSFLSVVEVQAAYGEPRDPAR